MGWWEEPRFELDGPGFGSSLSLLPAGWPWVSNLSKPQSPLLEDTGAGLGFPWDRDVGASVHWRGDTRKPESQTWRRSQ